MLFPLYAPPKTRRWRIKGRFAKWVLNQFPLKLACRSLPPELLFNPLCFTFHPHTSSGVVACPLREPRRRPVPPEPRPHVHS